MKKPTLRYDLVVVGSGPGGRRAAIQSAKLGKRVLVIEKSQKVGGVSVHTGTIPSKTMRETVLNLSGLRERQFYGLSYQAKEKITANDIFERIHKTLAHETEVQEHQYQRNNVDIRYGHARFLGMHCLELQSDSNEILSIGFDFMVIAVGTNPFRPDYIPFDGHSVIDSDELLQLDKLPGSLSVIGAGVIGLEYASIFSALSVQVNLIEPRAEILDFADRQIVDDFLQQLQKRDVSLKFGCSVERIEVDACSNKNICHLSDHSKLESDMVLFAAGRMGATESLNLAACGLETDHRGRILVNEDFQTDKTHIYAVGDVIGFPSLASTSMEQGRHAACHMFNKPGGKMSKFFPYGIYAVPEVSMVGLTEEQVRAQNIAYEVGICQFRETARGQIMGLSDGLMKCIFALDTQRLLGVHIVGEGATELIHIGQAVIALEGSLSYFLENAFNYPTLAEAYKVAALDAWNRMPHQGSNISEQKLAA